MNTILELGPWLWLIAAVVLIILESVIPGIHFVWFGIAASIVGVIALLTGIDWQWQVLIFAVLAALSAVIMRRYITPQNVPSDQPGLNERGSYYVDRIVVVEEAITNGRGRVRLGDTVWSAQGPDMAVGVKAKVERLDGTVLVVVSADAAASTS